jgi:hypothetical protein
MPDEKDEYGYGVYRVDYQQEQQDELNKNYEFNHDDAWGSQGYDQSKPVNYSAEFSDDPRIRGKHTANVLRRRNSVITNSRGEVSIRGALIMFCIGTLIWWLTSIGATNALFSSKDWESTRIALNHLINLSTQIFIPIGVLLTVGFALFRKFLWKGVMAIIFTGLTMFFGTGIYLLLTGVFFRK